MTNASRRRDNPRPAGPVTRPLRILIVGMMPPPFIGQALALKRVSESLKGKHHVHVVNIQFLPNPGDAGKFSIFKVSRFFEYLFLGIVPILFRRKFDILYCSPSGPSTFGLLKDFIYIGLARQRAKRTVYHFHGTGGFAYLETCPGPMKLVGRWTMFKPDLSIRPAPVTPNDAALCQSRRERIIFNGLDDPRLKAVQLGLNQERDGLVLCYTGAITEQKGIYDLIEVASLLRKTHPAFKLYMVGLGTDEEVSRLMAMVVDRDLQDHVVLTGMISEEEKLRLLLKTSVFVFPTFFRAETQPASVIEAMAFGVPTVASDWRGLNTLVEHGVTGYLAPPRNPKGFCDALVKLLDGGEMETFGLAARRAFEDKFTFERHSQELEDALVSVV